MTHTGDQEVWIVWSLRGVWGKRHIEGIYNDMLSAQEHLSIAPRTLQITENVVRNKFKHRKDGDDHGCW